MDKKIGVLALLLSAMVGACSNDESVINEGGENNGHELGYMAVNIVQPASAGSRATTRETVTGDFQSGTEDENKAREATFFIFDSSTPASCKSVQTIALDKGDRSEKWETSQSTVNPRRECIYNAVLVLDGLKDNEKFGGKIYCVLNAPSDIKSLVAASLTETNLKEKIGQYDASTSGTFIMTNSAYDDVCGTVFTDNQLVKSSSEALANPVDIYVERIVAKVTTTKSETFNNEGALTDASKNDSLHNFNIKITGIEIANIANKAYLFKKVDNTWPSWTNVNDADNHRSYWETVPSATDEVEANRLGFWNKKYADLAQKSTTDDVLYQEKNDLNIPAEYKYIQPNTTANQATAVLVTAQLTKEVDGVEKPVNLVWLKGGYFLDYSARSLVCTYLNTRNYAIKTVTGEGTSAKTEYRTINPGDIEWSQTNNGTPIAGLKDYQACAQVRSGRTVVKYNFTTKAEIEMEGSEVVKPVNDFLAGEKSYYAEVFKDGLCYYYKYINQTPVLGSGWESVTPQKDGVVRNHIYDLSLNGIQGIGTAVFDPDKVIIPETPKHDDFYYLAARVNVLKWKVVKQDIVFGE